MFGVHGALWGNAMTWWDHETGSIWSQPLGEAIVGPLAGARLEPMASTFTTWSAWRSAHPGTQALAVEAGITSFDLDEMLIVVDFGDETAAYPVPILKQLGVINDVVAGVEIAVISSPDDPDHWSVLSRRLDTEVVELIERDGSIVDVRTGTVWDPVRGLSISGELQGEVLNLLPGFTSFPDDYPTFWPDGTVWQP